MKSYSKIISYAQIFLSCLALSFGFPESQLLEDGQTFDFIVVGGGTGGCVVAARLADRGKYSVLVIQEGQVPNDNLNIPALGYYFQHPTEVKYYNTVPQRRANLAANGIIPYPIGKAIGGGSSVNGIYWNRGHPKDYNIWAKLLNDSSWNYENMLPFFRKTENYRGFNPTNQRGYGGPISIENASEQRFGIREFVEANKELGYPFGDANGPQTPSTSLADLSQYRGRRVNAFAGFIGPLLRHGSATIGQPQKQSNLIVLLNTEAKRIIFDGNKAVGVTYLNLNSTQPGFAKARKEVILSAGVMDSPAILMRSGIGPKSILDRANIPVVKYVEGVGRNLRDHVQLRYHLIYGNRSAALVPSRDLNPVTWKQYQSSGTGPYSLLAGGGSQGFFLSSLQTPSPQRNGWPDLQIMTANLEAPLPDAKGNEVAVAWILSVNRPKSKGTVTLDNNIENQPKIDLNLYDHSDDMIAMIDLIKFTNKLCEGTHAMQSIGCRLPTIPLPACSQFQFRTDSYYQCLISQLSVTVYRGSGTCKMGRKDDTEAVVDSKLKLIGIENLRITDASVMPVITNANTQAAVYAIAERAADMILKKWDKDSYKPHNLNV